MVKPALRADEAELAAAAGVLVESLGLTAVEAFAWIADESVTSRLPVTDVADLLVSDAARDLIQADQVQGSPAAVVSIAGGPGRSRAAGAGRAPRRPNLGASVSWLDRDHGVDAPVSDEIDDRAEAVLRRYLTHGPGALRPSR